MHQVCPGELCQILPRMLHGLSGCCCDCGASIVPHSMPKQAVLCRAAQVLLCCGMCSNGRLKCMLRCAVLQVTMVAASLLFIVGAGLQAGALNLGMLVSGRVILGFGVGAWIACTLLSALATERCFFSAAFVCVSGASLSGHRQQHAGQQLAWGGMKKPTASPMLHRVPTKTMPLALTD